MKSKGKKHHMGSHSRRSNPIKMGITKEFAKSIRSEPVFRNGKLVIEGGKVKTVSSKRKIGLKFYKKFANSKRRGFIKNDNRKQISEE